MTAYTRALVVAGLAAGLASGQGLAGQDDRSLPSAEPFLAATRANIDRARRAERDFAYRERRTELHLNPLGRLGTGGIVVYDVTPLASGGSERRLVERDGKPVEGASLERREPRARRLARRSPVDDTVGVLRFAMDRRELLDGRRVIAVRFEPKPDASAETREGSLAQRFTGTIFVDEALQEVVRVEATAAEDITYGLGMVARLGKGTTVRLTRSPVEEQVWMPTSIRFAGKGRALLFRRLEIDHVIEWFNYRRLVR